jgi:hypothetical protein
VPIDPKALEQLSRDELIAKANELGASRPELLTRPELRDEIIRLSTDDGAEKRQARGWFGVARDLVASVVSQGLNLPDTADLIRGVNVKLPKAGPPVATVTLAEIYAAQGHVAKALSLLDEVLAKEPDHEAARLARQRYTPVAAQATPLMPPEPEEELEGEVTAGEPLSAVISHLKQDAVSALSEEVPCSVEMRTATPAEGVSSQEAFTIAELVVTPPLSSVDIEVTPPPSPVELEVTPPPSPTENMPSSFCEEEERTTPAGSPVTTQQQADASKVAPTQFDEIEEDLLLVVHHGVKSPDCFWQLGRRSKARRIATESGVSLVIKVLEVEAGWDGPLCRESILELEGQRGQMSLPVAASEFRLVLGWLKGDRFVPLCLGVEFAWERDTGSKLLWAPPASQSNEAWERLGRQRLPTLFG